MLVAIKIDPAKMIYTADGMLVFNVEAPFDEKAPLCEIRAMEGETFDEFMSPSQLLISKTLNMGTNGGLSFDDLPSDLPVKSLSAVREERTCLTHYTDFTALFAERKCTPVTPAEFAEYCKLTEYRAVRVLHGLLKDQRKVSIVGVRDGKPEYAPKGFLPPLIKAKDYVDRAFEAFEIMWENTGKKPVKHQDVAALLGSDKAYKTMERLWSQGKVEKIAGSRYNGRYVPVGTQTNYSLAQSRRIAAS